MVPCMRGFMHDVTSLLAPVRVTRCYARRVRTVQIASAARAIRCGLRMSFVLVFMAIVSSHAQLRRSEESWHDETRSQLVPVPSATFLLSFRVAPLYGKASLLRGAR